MKRRNIIIGFGGVAGALSAGVGTGALSAARLNERDVDINVATDADALIGLIPNDDVHGVDIADDGRLEISLSDPGINVNSTYQFGYFQTQESEPEIGPSEMEDGPSTTLPLFRNEPESDLADLDSAFAVANQTNDPREIEFTFDVTSPSDSEEFRTQFKFQIHRDGGVEGYIDQPGGSKTVTADLESGEAFGVSFLIVAPDDGDVVGEEIDAEMSVSAREISE